MAGGIRRMRGRRLNWRWSRGGDGIMHITRETCGLLTVCVQCMAYCG